MRKIPTIYKRDPENPRVVTHEYNPACSWIQEGKSRATRKWDGTACMVKDGKLYKRYDCKKGRTPPPDAIPCDDPDPVTGHWPHWVPVGDGPEDRWHNEALEWTLRDGPIADGTYELLHQKFQGRDSAHINPEGVEHPILVLHGAEPVEAVSTNYDALKRFFELYSIEGIVWHNPDGRMAKIKARDFGIQRRPYRTEQELEKN